MDVRKQMTHSKAVKYTMIISWLLFLVAVAVWGAIHYYFYQLGYTTDEDWFESGLTFSVWGSISFICSVIGLVSPFIAIITTSLYIVERLKYRTH
jgi:uncharacterized membrane protein